MGKTIGPNKRRQLQNLLDRPNATDEGGLDNSGPDIYYQQAVLKVKCQTKDDPDWFNGVIVFYDIEEDDWVETLEKVFIKMADHSIDLVPCDIVFGQLCRDIERMNGMKQRRAPAYIGLQLLVPAESCLQCSSGSSSEGDSSSSDSSQSSSEGESSSSPMPEGCTNDSQICFDNTTCVDGETVTVTTCISLVPDGRGGSQFQVCVGEPT